MTRILAVNRARFADFFAKEPWTAGNVVHGNVYMSKVEFADVLVRHHLGQFLKGQQLNFRSPNYRFHIIMAPEVMDDEPFKQRVTEVLDAIGVSSTFNKTRGRGESSYCISGVRAAEVELIEYCDIEIRCR
ncbi:MAG TPA: hypothetical protein VJ579_04590 [Candidatus Paceibacterota bacterium]|nr:hypothetical protein [Candidatus Paceibacterota bacterium]